MLLSVIIPAYNEIEFIDEILRRVKETPYEKEIIVVDDCSTDGTREYLKNLNNGVITIFQELNQGKGAAILTGFAAAVAVADWAITMDADGQHYPEDARKLIKAIPKKIRPIVVGARSGMTGEHVPWTSSFGRKFSNFWVRTSGGPAISDSQSGFRIYPLPEALNLKTKARRFQFEVEILVQARRNGIPVIEAPVRVHYNPEGGRISHFRPFVDFCRNSSTFTRLIFRRIFPLR